MIELTPGQELPLVADDGSARNRLRLGLGWDHAPSAGFIGSGAPPIDLDASAVQFMGDQLFDLAFYNNLATRDGSVTHLGDSISGQGKGDDEAIDLDLAKVYGKVDTIVFMVSSYQGHTLEFIHHAYVRLAEPDGVEIARLTLTLGVPQTGLVMARLARGPEGWTLHAIGEGIEATVPTKAVDALRAFL